MTKFARKSSLRKAVSTICAVAMLASLVVVPAFAKTDAAVSAYSAGNTALAEAKSFANPGLNGVVSGEVSITPAAQAQQESNSIWQTPESKTTTLQSRGLNVTTGDPALRIGVVSPDIADLAPVSADTTYVVSVETTPGMTVAGMVDSINASFAALDASKTVGVAGLSDATLAKIKNRLMVKADFQSSGNIRLTKLYAEGGAKVFAFDNAALSAVNKGVADVIFSTADGLQDFGAGSGPAAQWKVGSDNVVHSLEATFTPAASSTKETAGYSLNARLGSFNKNATGSLSTSGDFAAEVDDVSGLFTGLQVYSPNGEWDLQFKTASRIQSVISGALSLTLGAGSRDAAFDVPAVIAPNVGWTNQIGLATAGKVETFTVTVPDATPVDGYNPDGVTTGGYQNAINGVRVLFPKGFDFAASKYATASIDPAQKVETSSTAYGPMVTVTDFHRIAGGGNLPVTAALTAPIKADDYDGVKVWIRNVGSDKWVPIFCAPNAPLSIAVVADVVDHVKLDAEVNRAGGYTLVTASAFDKNDNAIYDTFDVPAISPAGDGASISRWQSSSDKFVWKLAKTEGTNTATFSYKTKSASVSVNTKGIGEPAKLKVIPSAAKYNSGSMPTFELQLVDAAGNPTSFMDGAAPTDNIFSFKAVDMSGDYRQRANIHIAQGWSRSTMPGYAGAPAFFNAYGPYVGPYAYGPDVWTLTATSNGGLVAAASLSTIEILGTDPAVAGKPDHLELTAVKKAPAEYAVNDEVYNNKGDGIADKAFGYAKGDGSELITFTAQVVDAYGTPVTKGVSGIDVKFSIPKFGGINGTLPTGHVYNTKTDANGAATVAMKAYRATDEPFEILDPSSPYYGEYTWFTPVKAELAFTIESDNWAFPCNTDYGFTGWGFGYFHDGKMTASLEKTLEGNAKDIVLADNTDSTKFVAKVVDPAFDTPVANWPVKFTTNFGTIDGTKTVETKTGADGTVGVVAKSGEAGGASLTAVDAQRTSVSEWVSFTDWKVVATVLDSSVRAGDRAEAKVRMTWANIKDANKKLTWDKGELYAWGDYDVYANDADAEYGVRVANDTQGWTEVDTNADGKYEAVELAIPADDVNGNLESVGKRWALLEGYFSGRVWVGNVFYDAMGFYAAPARPETTFVKEATLKAEGTQLTSVLGLSGSKFTPGADLPDFTDEVEVYAGDITTGEAVEIGTAFVGRDGNLLPGAVLADSVSRMAPGTYDITVDGLVFKNGLVIKNLFNAASISVNGKSSGTIYLAPGKTYNLNVHALGAEAVDVWAGGLKLSNTSTVSTGMFGLNTSRIPYGWTTITARVKWMTDGEPYTTVVTQKVFVQKALSLTTPSVSASGRTLKFAGKAAGIAESNGSKAYAMKLYIQKYKNGKWVAYSTKTVKCSSSTGKYSLSYKVGSAGKYRVKAYHGDSSHLASYKYSSSKTVK